MNASIAEIARLVDGQVIGDENRIISSVSSIDNIQKNALVFAAEQDHFAKAENSEAGAVLVDQNKKSDNKSLIQVAHPYKAFVAILNHYYPPVSLPPEVHSTAVIGENVTLGDNIFVGPYVIVEPGAVIEDDVVLKGQNYIGHNVVIGQKSVLHPQVTVYDNCRIGSRVAIHASTVIGSDGFGYQFIEGRHIKMPHIANVIIEDEVEIGANSVVDRGSLNATVVGAGSKIDNLVQIAHSVKLGKNNILCAFTGISGSTTSGDNVVFAANVGVSDHVTIDDNVVLGARTGVAPKKHLREGQVYFGMPARLKEKSIETEVAVSRLPKMRQHIRHLKEQLKELNERLAKVEAKES